MHGRKVADLENYTRPVGHVKRNIRVKVKATPQWMSDELAKALTALFERHAIMFTGLVSGYGVGGNNAPHSTIEKSLLFSNFRMRVPEFSEFQISETLNYWIDGVIAEQKKTQPRNWPEGIDLVFYEVNATNTKAVRCWELPNVFPTTTGMVDGHMDLRDGRKHDTVIDEEITELEVEFSFDKRGARYNAPTQLEYVTDNMHRWQSAEGYAEPIVPGSTIVFTLDEHDPDQRTTVQLVIETARAAGINIVILDDKLNLLGDQPVDWDRVLKHAVKMPEQWNSRVSAFDAASGALQFWSLTPVPAHEVVRENAGGRTTDLWLRETRVFADGQLGQQYMNSFEHIRTGPRAADNDYTYITRNGQNVSMPLDYVERLHKVLDDLGVPQAAEITEQAKHLCKDLLGTEGELNRGMTRSLQAENFAQAEDEHLHQATASIKIPPKLRDKDQPGNEAPEGWVKPIATQADAGPAQDQSPA